MTRQEALAVATAKFHAMIAARINNEFKGGPAVNEAAFGYRHGWVSVGEFNFGTDEMIGPNNQPYMD